MNEGVIRAALDLLIRVIDATTGRPVTTAGAQFFRDGMKIVPAPRGEGVYILINTGREDFQLEVEISRYEKAIVDVHYGELDERLPLMEVFLIPKPDNSLDGFITLSGTHTGIQSIEAVLLERPLVNISSYDERKQLINLMATEGKYVFSDTRYALVNMEKKSFQYLYPGENLKDYTYRILKPLTEEFVPNSYLHRIIPGSVKGKEYLLRIRNDAGSLPCLIRYETKRGGVKFKVLDMAEVPGKEEKWL